MGWNRNDVGWPARVLMRFMKLAELHAREKTGMPENWCLYRWEIFPKSGREKPLYYQVTGMVAPMKTKGKYKGDHNWRAGDKTTERVVILPVSEHDAWVAEWEKKTGNCSNCTGKGQTLAKWSVANGAEYRTCSKCNGSGKHQNCGSKRTADSWREPR